MTLTSTATLRPQQLADFARDGCLLLPGLLDQAALEPVRRDLTLELDRRAEALKQSGLITDLHEQAPFSTRYGLLMAQSSAIQDQFDVVPIYSQAMFTFFHTPVLLEALSQLLGGELSLNPIHHVRAKPPQAQTADGVKGYFSVPWHQDSGVIIEEADASEIITVWLPLGDATDEMGCLQVLPTAHQAGHLPHVSTPGYGTAIRASSMPGIAPRKLPMRAGDVLFMHRHCPHHSTPNRSAACRWSLDFRFHRTGDNSGRPWQPEVRVSSQREPGAITRDYAGWVESWKACLARGDGRTVHRISAT